jgi:hypothetical protein
LGSGLTLALFYSQGKKGEVTPIGDAKESSVVTKEQNNPGITLEPVRTAASVSLQQAKPEKEAQTTQVSSQGPSQPFEDLKEHKVVSEYDLNIMAINALKTLPKQIPEKKLSEEEAHHLTAEALSQVQPLSDIAQALADNPNLKKPAFDFYEKCVDQDNLEHTVRAMCLTHMKQLAPQLGKKEQDEVDFVSRRLANNEQDHDIKEYSDWDSQP